MSHRPPRRAMPFVLAAAAVMLVLTACSSGAGPDDPAAEPSRAVGDATSDDDQPSDDETSESSPPASESPSERPSASQAETVPPFPDGTARQMGDNTRPWDLVLTDVRTGQHEGFDRVVLEFSGTGVPGWMVDYVDEGVIEGSGEVVELAGETTLDVYASGTTYPGSDAEGYDGPKRLAAGGGVVEVHVVGTFEGYTQVLAGVEGGARPFRVFALTDPPRLVVDVAADGG